METEMTVNDAIAMAVEAGWVKMWDGDAIPCSDPTGTAKYHGEYNLGVVCMGTPDGHPGLRQPAAILIDTERAVTLYDNLTPEERAKVGDSDPVHFTLDGTQPVSEVILIDSRRVVAKGMTQAMFELLIIKGSALI